MVIGRVFAATGSSGRRVAGGGVTPVVFCRAAAIAPQARSIGTTHASFHRLTSCLSSIALMPASAPLSAKTGPPALSPPTRTSEKIACVVTRVTAPSLTSLPPNIEAVIAVTVSL